MGPKSLVDRLQRAGRSSASAEEIALHTGVSTTTVHRVIADYNRRGATALETPGRGGRRCHYLTLEEEQAFLAGSLCQKGLCIHEFERFS